MRKSGKINRFKPIDTSWATKFPECAELFRAAGWFGFFERITGFNAEVSHHFSHNIINGTVIFNTLKLELIEGLIAKATGIPMDGEAWFKKTPFSFNPNDFLLSRNETLDWSKGVHLANFKPKWREVIGIIQSYITCDGKFASVFKYHVRFLQHLNQESKMNLPFFLLKSLQKMSNRIKGHFDHTN